MQDTSLVVESEDNTDDNEFGKNSKTDMSKYESDKSEKQEESVIKSLQITIAILRYIESP